MTRSSGRHEEGGRPTTLCCGGLDRLNDAHQGTGQSLGQYFDFLVVAISECHKQTKKLKETKNNNDKNV